MLFFQRKYTPIIFSGPTIASHDITIDPRDNYIKSSLLHLDKHIEKNKFSLNNFNELTKLFKLVRAIYEKECLKKVSDKRLMFELEQVICRTQRLLTIPTPKNNVDYALEVAKYNNNLDEMWACINHFSGHESPVMKYLGITLMLLGAIIVITNIFLATIPTLSAGYTLYLASVGLLNVCATIGHALGVSSVTAAAITGGTVGAFISVRGQFHYYYSRQRGLSKAVSECLEKTARL